MLLVMQATQATQVMQVTLEQEVMAVRQEILAIQAVAATVSPEEMFLHCVVAVSLIYQGEIEERTKGRAHAQQALVKDIVAMRGVVAVQVMLVLRGIQATQAMLVVLEILGRHLRVFLKHFQVVLVVQGAHQEETEEPEEMLVVLVTQALPEMPVRRGVLAIKGVILPKLAVHLLSHLPLQGVVVVP